MATLLLRLAGPLQSWGDVSRFNHRKTRSEPTKSGIFGLLAAAQGRRRTDPIEDLLELKFGVRCDQPGTLLRDFHTEIDWRKKTNGSMPLTHRYYLSDAVFIAAVDGTDEIIESLYDALLNPVFPLFLGRRSCPPVGPLVVGVRNQSFVEALRDEKWHAAKKYLHSQPAQKRLEITRDVLPVETSHETIRDLPISFDVRHRQYGWRNIVREYSSMLCNKFSKLKPESDPLELAEERNVFNKAGN